MRRGLSVWLLIVNMSLSLTLTGFGQDSAEKKEERAPDTPAEQPKKDADTPAVALRQFLTSMTAHDEEKLKSVAMPDDDLDILLEGEKPTAATLARMQLAMTLSPMKRLKVGDEIKLPGGRTLKIDETRVNRTRQSITAMGSPIPFDVQLIEEKWKVNPQPLIAARKAAKKAMEQNKQREAAENEAGK